MGIKQNRNSLTGHWYKSKAKQRCVMGVGMCLYAQLVQTKNKQCKSAIILQCYHPHLSDFMQLVTVTASTDVSGCSVWVCGTCDAKASSYLGSGRMTEVIRLVLYTEVLGPWDGDCAGGRLLSTDTGLADLLPLGVLNTSSLSTISSYGSIYLYISIIHSYEWRQDLVYQFLSFISKLNDSIQQLTV